MTLQTAGCHRAGHHARRAIATATALPQRSWSCGRYRNKKGPLMIPAAAHRRAGRCGRPDRVCGVVQHHRGAQHQLIRVISIVVDPLIEIVCCWRLAHLAAEVLTQLKLFNSSTNRQTLCICFPSLALAMAVQVSPVTIGFSSLLTCMMLGTLFCNLCPLSGEIMENPTGGLSPLRRSSSPARGWIWACSGRYDDSHQRYVYSDALSSKYLGAHYSAKLMKCEPQIL